MSYRFCFSHQLTPPSIIIYTHIQHTTTDIALSAAHCENLDHPFSTRVFINGLETEGGIYRTIQTQKSHPLYDPNSSTANDYDYMVLKLHTSALVDENGKATSAALVELNTDDTVPAVGDDLVAVGFGVTAEGGASVSSTLQDVTVQYVDDDDCESQYGTKTYRRDLMFCAGVPDGGKDTCQVRTIYIRFVYCMLCYRIGEMASGVSFIILCLFLV